jgi:putative nucleotidyltransferase with HDIG domain
MNRKTVLGEQPVKEVIKAVSLMVELKDPYTAGHQRRVATLARAIAAEMGLPERHVSRIYVSGLLHDVGKMVVPEWILNKSGCISQSEYNTIKQHCHAGYEILHKFGFPWPVKQAVLQHHERMDGSGYPYGLAGDEIVPDARIIAVADVVEAISSYRPYRPALGLEYALAEISRSAGTLYDPEAVQTCLYLCQRDEYELEWLVKSGKRQHADTLVV